MAHDLSQSRHHINCAFISSHLLQMPAQLAVCSRAFSLNSQLEHLFHTTETILFPSGIFLTYSFFDVYLTIIQEKRLIVHMRFSTNNFNRDHSIQNCLKKTSSTLHTTFFTLAALFTLFFLPFLNHFQPSFCCHCI